MRKLVTIQDCRTYKQISNSVKKEIFEQYILDAQIQDLAPLLGEELYFQLLNNTEDHEELLNGGNYVSNGKTFYNVGLKCVLSHYAYARYMLFGSVVDTPFSQVEKLNPATSQPVSDATKRNLYKENQDTAATYFGNVRMYLMRTDYAKYFKTNICTGVRKGSFRINKIG